MILRRTTFGENRGAHNNLALCEDSCFRLTRCRAAHQISRRQRSSKFSNLGNLHFASPARIPIANLWVVLLPPTVAGGQPRMYLTKRMFGMALIEGASFGLSKSLLSVI
jgi:hypothetical protein